jgi:hypothetical protein
MHPSPHTAIITPSLSTALTPNRDASELIESTLQGQQGKLSEAQIERALDMIATAVSEQDLQTQVRVALLLLGRLNSLLASRQMSDVLPLPTPIPPRLILFANPL